MKTTTKILLTSAVLIGGSMQANATDTNTTFTGVIPPSCLVTISTPGLIGASSDQTVLSTEETGGLAAVAAVVTNSTTSTIQVIPPVAFSVAPASGNANTTFATSYDTTGVTVADVADGNTVTALNLGLTAMTIDASATKSSGTFDAGAYEFVATVRCVNT